MVRFEAKFVFAQQNSIRWSAIVLDFYELLPEMMVHVFHQKLKGAKSFKIIHLSTQFSMLIPYMIFLPHKSSLLMKIPYKNLVFEMKIDLLGK